MGVFRPRMSEHTPPGSVGATLGLGLVFVTLGSFRILLIKFSANKDHTYDYLPVTVNVSAEFVKLAVCFILAVFVHLKDGRSIRTLLNGEWNVSLLKWAVPGFLYFCDNLLSFYIIKHIQPAIAILLGNFGIITTAVLFRLILKRELSHIQWASLGILFLAVMSLSSQSGSSPSSQDSHQHHLVDHVLTSESEGSIPIQKHSRHARAAKRYSPRTNIDDICRSVKTVSTLKDVNETEPHDAQDMFQSGNFTFNKGYIFILLQCLIASLANIYNEKIFKEELKGCIFIKNCKLYMFGVLFNSLLILIPDAYRENVFTCGLFHGHNVYSAVLIFVTAFYGLNVALILIFRDNMFHVFSLQIITVIVITASMYFFRFRPKLNFFFSAPIVLLSIYIYNATKIKVSDVNGAASVHRTHRARHRSGASLSEDDGLVEHLVHELDDSCNHSD